MGILPFGVHEDTVETKEAPKISGGIKPMDGPHGPLLYARKGEEVTCENGHTICEVRANIWFGEPYNPGRDFIRWRQPEPLIGTAAESIKCKQCGARWFLRGMVLHFKDGGWRYHNAEGLLRGEWQNRPTAIRGEDLRKLITPVGKIIKP